VKASAQARSFLLISGAALAAALGVLTPEPAPAEERSFLPRLVTFDGELEAGMTHESYENQTDGRGLKTSDTMATERLRLGTRGFVYHPRFVTFRLMGALGLRQERFSSEIASQRSSAVSEEYDLRAWILPEHPYNLEVYTSRRNPLLGGRITPGTDLVSQEKGVIGRYTRMPLFLEVGTNDVSTTGQYSYRSATSYASGSYFLGPTATTATYSHVTATNAAAVSTIRDRYYAVNDISVPLLTLQSRWELQDDHQEEPTTAPADTERMNWMEDLSFPLPGNFRTDLNYSVSRDRVMSMAAAPPPFDSIFTRTENERVSVSHDLYASLRTSYNINYTVMDSTGGESRNAIQTLNALYTKRIPKGRLTAGGSLSSTNQERRGAPVVFETHQTAAPGVFDLNLPLADVSSVSVWVVDPSGALVPLVAGMHYTMSPSGPPWQITISAFLPVPPASSYTFIVTYTPVSANVELHSEGAAYNLSLELFDSRINPYYNHMDLQQEVVSGFLPGGPDDVTSDTVGLRLRRAPYSVLGEYQNYRSRLNPFEGWKLRAEYRVMADQTDIITGLLSHSRTVYPLTLTAQGSRGYSDELTELGARIERNLPRRRINLIADVSYTLRRTYATTETFSAHGSLLWQIGQLDVRTGVSISYAASALTVGRQRAMSEYYYLTLTRSLF
jgi:hypothetical protein